MSLPMRAGSVIASWFFVTIGASAPCNSMLRPSRHDRSQLHIEESVPPAASCDAPSDLCPEPRSFEAPPADPAP